MRANGKRVLVPPGDAESRIFRDILCRLPHDEITHRIREPHHQTDARRKSLEVEKLRKNGEGAGDSVPDASRFAVLQEEVGHGRVVHNRDTAHCLHADDEHRVSVAAPDAQARVVEGGHAGSAVFPGYGIGGDRRRESAGDGGNPRRVDRMHGRCHVAAQHAIDCLKGEIPAMTSLDHFADDPGTE